MSLASAGSGSPPVDHSRAVAWIGFLQKLIWPMIALIAILIFQTPVYQAIDRASNGGGATVEIGTLKITLPKNDIPPPPETIKAILPQLDAGMIEKIIANVGQSNKVDTCYDNSKPDELEAESIKMRLKKMGLIKFDKEDRIENGKPCAAASLTTYTATYDQVRSYLIDILKSLKFAN